jgi:hypothetical protein
LNELNNNLPWECGLTFGTGVKANVKGYEPFPQWPIKLRQISVVAPYFHHAHLLLAADCSAFAYGNFHKRLTNGRVALVCCPSEYGDGMEKKLADILTLNDIESVTLVRMDAPCCCAAANVIISAIKRSAKDIPLRITTVFVEGEVVD